MFYCTLPSPLGKLMLSSDGENLTGLWFHGRKYQDAPGENAAESNLPVFDETREWLKVYFSGNAPGFNPKLLFRGSNFQLSVWKMLGEIPYGKTITYGEIAKRIANDRVGGMSAQAVGGAVGRNPISILIPCHRVIGANGRLTGYTSGVDLKIKLLKLEGIPISNP